MTNPLFKTQQSKNQFNMNSFKEQLIKQPESFFEKMKAEARSKGISEYDIEAGMKFIESLRK